MLAALPQKEADPKGADEVNPEDAKPEDAKPDEHETAQGAAIVLAENDDDEEKHVDAGQGRLLVQALFTIILAAGCMETSANIIQI